jgi:hypothetical protein
MKTTLTLAAVAATTFLCSVSAYASCAGPGNISTMRQMPHITLPKSLSPAAGQHQGDAASAIVGTWFVTYTVQGETFGQAYIQWHSDGTEWENIDFPTDSGNICMGSWMKVDSKHVYRNHYGWLYTSGQISGYFNETETAKVGHNGTYAGDTDMKIYDLEGNLQEEITGTSAATFIAP